MQKVLEAYYGLKDISKVGYVSIGFVMRPQQKNSI